MLRGPVKKQSVIRLNAERPCNIPISFTLSLNSPTDTDGHTVKCREALFIFLSPLPFPLTPLQMQTVIRLNAERPCYIPISFTLSLNSPTDTDGHTVKCREALFIFLSPLPFPLTPLQMQTVIRLNAERPCYIPISFTLSLNSPTDADGHTAKCREALLYPTTKFALAM